MKLIIGITLVLAFNLFGVSQSVNTFEFIGTLTIEGGEAMTYKIVFNTTENNNNIIGYSLTDFSGENKTRTSISGTYDNINNTLSFIELANVNTKVEEPDSTFCFIKADNLEIKYEGKNKLISGQFMGVFPTGEFCAEGMIYLIEQRFFEKIKSSIETKKAIEKPKKTINDSIEIINEKQKIVLKANEEIVIYYKGKDLSIYVWDGGMQDNDMIKIYVNDEIFNESITLTSKKKEVIIPNGEGKLRLKIVALNNGKAGINTVNFELNNSYNVKGFSSILNKGESFHLEFKKK
jgi:hypothetical protein